MKNFEIAINERVIEAIKSVLSSKYGENQTEFAKNFNISPSKFTEILKKRMKAGMDIIQKLCDEYDVSADWIVTGRGEMYRNTEVLDNGNTETSNSNIRSLIEILNRTLIEKDKQIDRLLSIIEQGKV